MSTHVYIQISLPIGYGKLPTPEQEQRAKQRAAELQKEFERIGFKVLNPFEFPAKKHFTYTDYLQMCKYMMFSFRPIMYFDNGWSDSNGCREEMLYANELKLDIRLPHDQTFRHLHVDYQKALERQMEYDFQTQLNLS